MLAPLSIMKVDPDINASALHWSMTENRSESAGMMKMVVE